MTFNIFHLNVNRRKDWSNLRLYLIVVISRIGLFVASLIKIEINSFPIEDLTYGASIAMIISYHWLDQSYGINKITLTMRIWWALFLELELHSSLMQPECMD